MRSGSGRLVLHVAARYLRATRSSGRVASSALSIIGVASGVMTLISVMGVMNGFQLGFIEDIVEVSSYHLQIAPEKGLSQAVLDAIRRVEGVTAVVAFVDNQAIVESDLSEPTGCMIRGIEAGAFTEDRGFAEHFQIVEGRFDAQSRDGIMLGVELARGLGLGVGENLRLLALSSRRDGGVEPRWETMRVAAVFRTGYYDYDVGMAFVSLPASQALFWGGDSPPLTYGIKLADRFADRQASSRVELAFRGATAGGAARVESWREFNRAFFSALRLEKVLMLTLPGIIFVVVAFSIFHSLRRTVHERREEIALLSALGARSSAIRAIFVLEGSLIGLAGAIPGLLGGLAVSANINRVFSWVESAVNGLISIAELLVSPLAGGTGGSFSVFSPSFFYLSEVPSRVLLPETLGITLAGVLCAATAALLASSRIVSIAPAEVLRYE